MFATMSIMLLTITLITTFDAYLLNSLAPYEFIDTTLSSSNEGSFN